MINYQAALILAQGHLPEGFVLLPEYAQECEFGFYFGVDSLAHQTSGRFEDIVVGSCGVLVDRETGDVHDLGSSHSPAYWFEAYRRKLHLSATVVVTGVQDRQRAAEALLRLGMSYIIPDEAHGEIWRIPQLYKLKDFKTAFDDLPARFPNQHLIFSLREIERIEIEDDCRLEIQTAASKRK
jgi:hypothetical protein